MRRAAGELAPAPRQFTASSGGGKPSSISSASVLVARSSERRVLERVDAQPVLEARPPRRALDPEVRREHADRPPVGDDGRDVRPLARVVALGEQPAELVERPRRLPQDAVRVMVDEPRSSSVLLEVTLVLEFLVLRGVGRPLGAADGEVGAGELVAERARSARRRRRARRAPRPGWPGSGRAPALALRQRRRVDVDRRRAASARARPRRARRR